MVSFKTWWTNLKSEIKKHQTPLLLIIGLLLLIKFANPQMFSNLNQQSIFDIGGIIFNFGLLMFVIGALLVLLGGTGMAVMIGGVVLLAGLMMSFGSITKTIMDNIYIVAIVLGMILILKFKK